MKRICVYAGSNLGVAPEYALAAEQLGRELATAGLELVYGGSRIGLMGRLADAVLSRGGKVTGVMPSGLFQGEIVHEGLTDFIETADMHERKATMADLADAFIALPGGLGTFEELFEALSWSQLGIHRKPIGLLDTKGFYRPLHELFRQAVQTGFAKPSNLQLFVISESPSELLEAVTNFQRPELERKWDQLQPSANG